MDIRFRPKLGQFGIKWDIPDKLSFSKSCEILLSKHYRNIKTVNILNKIQ